MIVNELGEVGLDHHLLRRVDERTVLLGERLRLLRAPRRPRRRAPRPARPPDAGEIPPFGASSSRRPGVADPTPIVNTLLTDPFVPHHYELDAVVATIDGAARAPRDGERETGCGG